MQPEGFDVVVEQDNAAGERKRLGGLRGLFAGRVARQQERQRRQQEQRQLQRWAAESGGLSFLVRAGVGERRARVLTKAFKEQGFETEEDFSLLRDGDLLSDAALRSRDIGMRDHEVRKLRAAAAEAYAEGEHAPQGEKEIENALEDAARMNALRAFLGE